MNKESDVICLGAALVDIPLQPVDKNIFNIESYPLERIAMVTGGDALNEAMIISRLGYKVTLLSKLGKDAAGKFVLEACDQDGIDTSSVVIDENIETSINVGLVTEDGERTFITNKNGSLWKLDIDDLDFSSFKDAKLLSLASFFNSPLLNGNKLVKIFKKAKEHGLIICADMIKPRLNEKLHEVAEALSYVDYFFPNYDEAKLLTEKTEIDAVADIFLGYGVRNIVIKNGKKGCYIKNSMHSIPVAAYKNIKAVDTIGAGDNFVAGFITALLDGRELIECAKFANATAAIAVQSVGATTGVHNRVLVDKLYGNYEGNDK